MTALVRPSAATQGAPWAVPAPLGLTLQEGRSGVTSAYRNVEGTAQRQKPPVLVTLVGQLDSPSPQVVDDAGRRDSRPWLVLGFGRRGGASEGQGGGHRVALSLHPHPLGPSTR